MSASQALNQGKAALTEKRYEDSIRYFSTVLSTSKGSDRVQLHVYDLRCQAYCKLGKLDLALQDARNMIHVSKRQEAGGYLRCSQIECLSGNFTAAARWLEHGSKYVPEQQPIFEKQLEKVQKLAANALSSQKPQDLLSSVPFEILQMILEYLEYHEIVSLLRVSRTWKNTLSRLQPLTTIVDFSRARRKVSYQGCGAAFRRLCRQPQQIILTSLSQAATKVAQTWLEKFPNLETLEVLSLSGSDVYMNLTALGKLRKIKSFSVGKAQKVSLAMMTTFIGQHQSLQDFGMYGISNQTLSYISDTVQTQLQHLCLEGNNACRISIPADYFRNLPNLRSIVIRQCFIHPDSLDLSSHTSLRVLKLTLSQQPFLNLSLPDSLEDLSCVATGDSYGTLSICEPTKLPNLSRIELRKQWACAAIDVIEHSQKMSTLQDVRLSDVKVSFFLEKVNQGSSIFSGCRRLLLKSEALKDEDSSLFTALFPAIEVVVIEAPLITGVFISDIVSKSRGSLREVTMKDCGKISPDISEWLRSRNIKCQIVKTPQEVKGIRSIPDMW